MQRHARYEAIVQKLLDREVEERDAREKRQLGYKQSLDNDANRESDPFAPDSPVRLHKFRTKVPCRITPEARMLLEQLREQFRGSTVSFLQFDSRQQAVMLTGPGGLRKQIGWVEHTIETDAKRCNVRNHGLAVETDGTMLFLRFRYPRTPVRLSASDSQLDRGDEVRVDFTEIRTALDLHASGDESSPRLVWLTRPEIEMLDIVGSRDYEAFYVRFKLEVQAGIWKALSALLSSAPPSQWHRGAYYTVVREQDVANGIVFQSTIDDSGIPIDIGLDRLYDVTAATDILMLYLAGDILAEFVDIYFTLQSLAPADAQALKQRFFTQIRDFWASTPSLTSRYGNEIEAVLRMAQRALPTPSQMPLLKQDWTRLRQSLVDCYGEGGENAGDLVRSSVDRQHESTLAWPFASFAAGDVNIGLRLVYRQEWRHLAADRNDTPNLTEVVSEAAQGAAEVMKWRAEIDGSISIGVRALAARTDVELESRESSCDISERLDELMRRMASLSCDETMQNDYDVVTRPAELQNVVLVAEPLPAPAEIDRSWVEQHDWILAKVLLDESFRDALTSIREDTTAPGVNVMRGSDHQDDSTQVIELIDPFASTALVRVDGVEITGDWTRAYREPALEQPERVQRDVELEAKRERLYEHIRANILHYQQAIWQQEDPQQRSMRYRKSGRKVPLDWQFELESGEALTVDELSDRLSAPNVDGQFATYSSGRDAYLDEVIDPSGPIGFYGNYAIYHMRPEFGSEDVFSMLHFFKSPYLRANPHTAEPEVADPVQIQLSENSAVVLDSIREIEVLSPSGQVVPEAECAILPCARQPMLTLLAGTGPASALGENARAEIVAHDQSSRFTLPRDTEDPRDDAPAIVLAEDAARTPDIVVSAAAHREDEQLIFTRGSEELTSVRVGVAASAGDEKIIIASDHERPLSLVAGAGVASRDERLILPTDDAERASSTLTGAQSARVQQPEPEQLILTQDGKRIPLLHAGPAIARIPDRAIDPQSAASRAPILLAGAPAVAAHDPNATWLIVAPDDQELRPTLIAG